MDSTIQFEMVLLLLPVRFVFSLRCGFEAGWFESVRGWFGPVWVCSGLFWLTAAGQERFGMGRAGQIPSGQFGAVKFGPPGAARTNKKETCQAAVQI